MKGLAASTQNQGLPAREFNAILSQISNSGVEIPATAQTVYQDLILEQNPMRLYAVSWPFMSPENTPEWMLLLVLCRLPGKGGIRMLLPDGIKLRVSDRTGISVQKTLTKKSVDPFLCVLIAGSWQESFVANITLANGVALKLPPLSFRPVKK